jgi:hypothetical protein
MSTITVELTIKVKTKFTSSNAENIQFSDFPIRVEDTAAAELLDIERVQKSISCNQSQLLRV